MFNSSSDHFIAYVWHPQRIGPDVMNVVQQTSSRAIFDLTSVQPDHYAPQLKAIAATDVKISLEDLMASSSDEFLSNAGIKTIWVEYHPACHSVTPELFLARCSELERRYRCIPITGDLNLLQRLILQENPLTAVALKGSEAAGFVSSESIQILFAAMRQGLTRQPHQVKLVVWGGLATPEAAAAFLATGAAGIVFESLHWQTDLGAMGGPKEFLAKLHPEHTSVVGGPLGVHCRLYNKGNSVGVKEADKYVRSLVDGPVSPEKRQALACYLTQAFVSPLESEGRREHLIPLGPEAAFAPWFAERFGRSAREALGNFHTEISQLLAAAPQLIQKFVRSPAASALRTQYPFIQGAMTWITDKPEFAVQVSEAGGLPTIALGLRTYEQLQKDLGPLNEKMGTRPYAVNLMALPENSHLADQLAWIRETSPPFVAIAAGPPTWAIQLREEGLETIYITADIGLMGLALEGGVRWVVLEGNEAGGHVGAHSSLTLAQLAMERRWRQPELFQDRYLMMAGGIYNRETAARAAILGADGLQMGTAYLATEEIVATGALTPLYQKMIIASQPGETLVSGESIGLRVRSLPNPKLDAILALERKFLTGQEDEASFRQRLELESAKSLFRAAQGLDQPEGSALDEGSCWQQGQFMSGAVGGLIEGVMSVRELHRELAEGGLNLAEETDVVKPLAMPLPRSRGNQSRERVAITGMALVNSLGNNPQSIWEAALAMKSGVTSIPPSKWDHSKIYDPTPGVSEKTYCQVGAFLNIHLSRQELGIPPQDFRTMASSTRLTMYLANQAILDSGILDSDIPRERIAVIISQNSGESANTLSELVISLSAPKLVQALRGLMPLTPELAIMAEKLIRSGNLTVDDTTLLGRLNSAAGGFISNKFGFRGPCYSVTAACATSLVAIHTAIQMIYNGTIDAAIVGGGEESLTPAHFIEFSALGALAGISGGNRLPDELSRPFDARRDGFVLGEGGGMIVLERESLAQKRGARINAFITGVGASNNDLGMVESVAETQKIALEASFAALSYEPDTIDLVECHATGTMQGDIEEVKALAGFFSKDQRTILSSFKSQIGHSLGASGLNSMIRSIKALQSGIFPGTLNYQEPDPAIDLEGQGFYVPTEPVAWPRPGNRPRRFMVNAFGFGGANFVVHLEEALNDAAPILVSPPDLAKRDDSENLDGGGVSFFRATLEGSPCRLGVVAPSDQEAKKKSATLIPVKSPFSPKAQRTLAQQGIFIGREDDSPLPLALVFAGQGTFYPGMGQELYKDFPLIREWMDRVASLAEFDLLDRLFNAGEEELKKTLWQQPALFTLEYALVRLLLSLGVRPTALAGHSMGELTALCVAGVFSFEDAFKIINKRAQCMDKVGSLNQDPGAMIAVDVPMAILQEKVKARQQVHVTNFNSPRQIILGGATEEILALKEEIEQEGYWTVQLRVSMAFHSPIMKPICDELAEFINTLKISPPQIPVISNTTKKPYPDDPQEIKKIIIAHLQKPVHWMQNVQTLWDDFGIRTFVEVGPKDTLSNLIADTIEEAKCIKTCYPDSESTFCRAAVAELFALGHVAPPRAPSLVDFPCLAPVNLPVPTPTLGEPTVPSHLGTAAAVVQREINSFILETFGKFLKPTLLAALRRDIDPAFSEIQLEEVLDKIAGSTAAPSTPEASWPVGTSGTANLPLAATTPIPAPSSQELVEVGDYLEEVIRIIMAATGYERHEIEPQMNIRSDLSIRSSRLPIIMDAAERRFGIKVKVEDFIGLRTVQELADRIAQVKDRDEDQGTDENQVARDEPQQESEALLPLLTQGTVANFNELQRLIFQEIPLGTAPLIPWEKAPDGEVAIFSFNGESELTQKVAEFLKNELQLSPVILNMAEEYDLHSASGLTNAVTRLAASKNLAGLIFLLDPSGEPALATMGDISTFLTGYFTALQNFLRLPTRRFCLSIQQSLTKTGTMAVAAEGVVGMLLDAALEYESVLFRSLTLDLETDLDKALARALDQGNDLMQLSFHGQEAFGIEARPGFVVSNGGPDINPKAGEVIIISGGAQGISPHLAFALAPFNPRLVLLGRSELDPSVDREKLQSAGATSEAAIHRWVTTQHPDLTAEQSEVKVRQIRSTLNIMATLEECSRLGMEATYYSCDVADRSSVQKVLDEVVLRCGRIGGVIHGAGVLRDALIDLMTPEDFTEVLNVKLLGAWNLYEAAGQHGLNFFFMLSSVTAIQGNIGQINYCAANRAMSALAHVIATRQPQIKVKALMLPPVEGVGMAADSELEELMKLRGWDNAYLKINELVALFTRELFLGPPAETWVMFIKNLPQVKTTRLNLHYQEPAQKCLTSAGVAFPDHELPMISSIHRMDLDEGLVEAERIFSLEHDLWINDHRPFKFLRNPFVSGIMAIETFIEAAHLLYPHLRPLGICRVEYRDIVEVPPDVGRKILIVCHRLDANGSHGNELHCQAVISSPDITRNGRVLDRWSTNYVGEVILGNGSNPLNLLPDFPISPEEIETSPMNPEVLNRFYQKYSNMGVRYRTIESLEGAGKGVVRGRMVYKHSQDFANLNGTKYQYSPYLLEALKHLVNCYLLLWDEDTFQAMIPYQIGEMRYSRNCQPDEPIILEGRIQSNSPDGYIWDAQAIDASGKPIMQVKGLVFKPFAE